jgi:hypothetical protein
MAVHDDGPRLMAERLLAIFTAARGRPPIDVDELETFIEMEVRRRAGTGSTRPRGSVLRH